MLPSQITTLHHELSIKKDTLVKLCARNYITSYGLVNGEDENSKNYTKIFSKLLVWICFQNSQIGINTRIENSQMYKEFPTLDIFEHRLNKKLLKYN
jgi:hypothetical protein